MYVEVWKAPLQTSSDSRYVSADKPIPAKGEADWSHELAQPGVPGL